MGRHDTISYKDNTHTAMVVELKPIDVNTIYNLVDHIIDNSSRDSISNQFNNKGTNQTNTIHSVVPTKYIQLISSNDTDRTNNLFSNPLETGHNMLITTDDYL
jgi:hypothetical protein